MRNFESDHTDLSRSPGFHSFKSLGPVHYPRRWQRDALIQAALDPVVTAIGPLDVELIRPPVEFGFCVTMASTTFACLIGDCVRRPAIGDFGSAVLTLNRQALKTEPLNSTARAVWSRKRLVVDPVVRYRVLELTSQQERGVPVRSVLEAMSPSSADPIEQLHALLAQGFVTADLSAGLHGGTLLRAGPQFAPQKESNPRERLRLILSSQP